MSTRFLKLVFALLIISIVSYIFYLNPNSVDVVFSAGSVWKLPLALVLIVSFCLGAVIASLIAMYFGFKLQLRNRWERKQKESLLESRQQILSVREEIVLGNYAGARTILSKILSRHPDDVMASILLAESYYKDGDKPRAIEVLEDARISQNKNAEVLLMASGLYEELGNKTASYDNAALALKQNAASIQVIKNFIEKAKNLGRYAEAIDHQKILLKNLSGQEYYIELDKLAQLELLQAKELAVNDKAAFREKLEDLRKRYKDIASVLLELAKASDNDKETEFVSKLFIKSYQQVFEVGILEKLFDLWMQKNNPAKCISALSTALNCKTSNQVMLASGQLFFICVLLKLEMLEQAQDQLSFLREENITNEAEKVYYQIVKAVLYVKGGNLKASFKALSWTIIASDFLVNHPSAKLIKESLAQASAA